MRRMSMTFFEIGIELFEVDEKAQPGGLHVQVDIRSHVPDIDQRQVLIDGRDSGQALGILGAAYLDGFAVNVDLARILVIDTGEDLDQRGLTGAVVANQSHHFGGIELEVDVVQRLDVAERL